MFVAMILITLIVYIDSTSNMAHLSEWGDPLKITHDRPEFFIKINTGTQAEITEACKKLGLPENATGCARFPEVVGHTCEIWIPKPRGLADFVAFNIAGHELWHCKLGALHKVP